MTVRRRPETMKEIGNVLSGSGNLSIYTGNALSGGGNQSC